MKRFTALFLAICLVMLPLLTGCQGNSSSGSNSNENDKTQNGGTVGNENADSTQGNDTEGENDQSGTVKYMTYDDLPITQYFCHFDTDQRAFYNYPAMREDNMLWAYSYTLSSVYNIFVSTQDYDLPAYSGSVEGMFDELMPLFLRSLAEEEGEWLQDKEQFEGLDVTTSVVTLDTGIQAIKFEGTQESFWRENTDYAVYGYLFVHGDFNLAFGYCIHVKDGSVDPEIDVEQLRDYVDRMVLTVRSEE